MRGIRTMLVDDGWLCEGLEAMTGHSTDIPRFHAN